MTATIPEVVNDAEIFLEVMENEEEATPCDMCSDVARFIGRIPIRCTCVGILCPEHLKSGLKALSTPAIWVCADCGAEAFIGIKDVIIEHL